MRAALVAGSSVYADARLKGLRAPGRDARALAEILSDPALGAFDQVKELHDPDEKVLRRELALFFNRRVRDDLVLFYFSGHGVLDENGDLYLATTDTDTDLVSATAVPVTFLRQQMDRSNSRRQIVLLDCCNSGAFARGAKAQLGRSVGTSSALKPEGYGRIVITASDALEYAWDGEALEQDGAPSHSVFTDAVVQGLRSGEADANGDGEVTADELYDHVYRRVLERGGRQKPHRFADQASGDLVVSRTAAEVVRPVPLEQELLARALDPKMLIRLSAVEDLAAITRGAHKGLAVSAVQQLKELASHDDSKKVSQAAAEAVEKYESQGVVRRASPTSATRSRIAQTERPPSVPPLGGHAAEEAATSQPPPRGDVPRAVPSPPSILKERSSSGVESERVYPSQAGAASVDDASALIVSRAATGAGLIVGVILAASAAIGQPSSAFDLQGRFWLSGLIQGLAVAFAIRPKTLDGLSTAALAVAWTSVWAANAIDVESTYFRELGNSIPGGSLVETMAFAAQSGMSGWPGGLGYFIGGVAIAWAAFYRPSAFQPRDQSFRCVVLTVLLWAIVGLFVDLAPQAFPGVVPTLLVLGFGNFLGLLGLGLIATNVGNALAGEPKPSDGRASSPVQSGASPEAIVPRALLSGALVVAAPLTLSGLDADSGSQAFTGALAISGLWQGMMLAVALRPGPMKSASIAILGVDAQAFVALSLVWCLVWAVDGEMVGETYRMFEAVTLAQTMAVAAREGWPGWPGAFGYAIGSIAIAFAAFFRPSLFSPGERAWRCAFKTVVLWTMLGFALDLVPQVISGVTPSFALMAIVNFLGLWGTGVIAANGAAAA